VGATAAVEEDEIDGWASLGMNCCTVRSGLKHNKDDKQKPANAYQDRGALERSWAECGKRSLIEISVQGHTNLSLRGASGAITMAEGALPLLA
jgi:hypothetical protein